MEERTILKTFDGIKVYETLRDIGGEEKKVSVVEIQPGFEDIRYFLNVYDEVLALNNPILITGTKILIQNIEPLLQILCDRFTIVEVQQPRFWENLELVVDLFIVRPDPSDIDEGVLSRYVEVWNGKNLFFDLRSTGPDQKMELEALAGRLGLAEKGIPFRIEGS